MMVIQPQRQGNNYSFLWNHKKIVLVPQDEKLTLYEGATSKKKVTISVTSSKLFKDLKTIKQVIIFVTKEC